MSIAQASASIQPAGQDVFALRQVFRSIRADSCPRHYNFHMHTVCSDGRLQPEQLIQQAIAIGLQGLAITDHHSIEGYRTAQQWLSRQKKSAAVKTSTQLWTGVEINAGLLNTDVHILGYAFNPADRSMHPYLQGGSVQGEAYRAERVIHAIHTAGGMAVLAHPARYRRSPADLIPEAARLGIDGVEAYYAYDNPCPWRPSPDRTRDVYRLGKAYDLLITCGTDTHGLNLLQRL